jgi:hypothetical protein
VRSKSVGQRFAGGGLAGMGAQPLGIGDVLHRRLVFAFPEAHHGFAHGVALEAAEIELLALEFHVGEPVGVERGLLQQLGGKSIRPR